MRELNENIFYDLSNLNDEEVKTLFEWYKKNQHRNQDIDIVWLKERIQERKLLSFYKDDEGDELWGFGEHSNTSIDAKELFYTLENIQVDCRELSEGQINNMKTIVENSGYKTNNGFYRNINHKFNYYFFKSDNNKTEFYFGEEVGYKTTITYDKFMELFGRKEENFKKLVEVLNEELTEKAYEVSYIAEKPKQYQIGIDTFERCEANMTKEEILACVRFNIDKYTWRNKGQDLEDLEKIISYANWGIKQLKK